jgi:ABC-2 type transport system ATP-binding protein
MTIIDCVRLGRSFGGVAAVEEISFSMEAGESLALVGPNGAGKSTTLGMLTTAIRPDRGEARVLGADIGREPERVRAGLGVLFQEPALDDRLTSRENLSLHAALHDISRAEARRRVAAALDWADLGAAADRLVRGLSGGMRRRIELARALMHEPKLLVLDEPTIGLDPQGRRDLWSRIDTLRASGLAVLLTTHVIQEAERCDRVAIIDRGRLVAIDTPLALKLKFAKAADASMEDVFVHLTGRALRDGDERQPGRSTLARRQAS